MVAFVNSTSRFRPTNAVDNLDLVVIPIWSKDQAFHSDCGWLVSGLLKQMSRAANVAIR